MKNSLKNQNQNSATLKSEKNFFQFITKLTDELESKLKETISKSLKEKIPGITNQQIDLIINNLAIVLGTTFANYGSVAAKIIGEGLEGMTELKKSTAFQEIYKQKILKIIPVIYHKDLDKLFNDLFSNPSEEFSEYLFSMAQSYVILEILNIDPELKNMQKMSWSKKNICDC